MLMTIGKLSTAIRMELLLVFEEMPDIRLRDDENPVEVSNRVRRNTQGSSTTLPINKANKRYPASDIAKHKRLL